MTSRKSISKGIIIGSLVVGCAMCAFATMSFNSIFSETYNPKADSALGKAGCMTCHADEGCESMNAYGKALKGKLIVAKSLRSVENQDSDKDGFSNIVEIKAGTLPGNAKSKPAK